MTHGYSTLLDRPAEEGARLLALMYLEAARVARAGLTGSADPEALHDYRVALRRLRSCLRSYRREFRSTVTRKSRRRLDRLAHATNQSRDLDVHLAWLAAQRERAGEAERPGVAWLAARLTEVRRRARPEMLAADQRLFPTVDDRLRRQLGRYRTTIRLDGDDEPPTLAAAAARHTEAAARRLERRLRRIEDETSEAEIHRARIAAKHLRYLLEPFAEILPAGDGIIGRLKSLQDTLGDVHDAHVFLPQLGAALHQVEGGRRTEPGPGLRRLADALRARGSEAFRTAAREWLAPGDRSFFEDMRAARRALAHRPRPGREVERKYLLTGLPPAAAGRPSAVIEQGYLPGERLVERLRRIRTNGGVRLVRTVKEGSGLVRLEIEETVTPEVFQALWPLTAGRRLRKRRYRVPDGDLTWEIDEFLDRDLVLAEVELPSVKADLSVPEWLRPSVAREVTDDPAYGNAELSRAPMAAGSAQTVSPMTVTATNSAPASATSPASPQ
jgi:CHAD domain-containing protein/CYTH domain-containing protein